MLLCRWVLSVAAVARSDIAITRNKDEEFGVYMLIDAGKEGEYEERRKAGVDFRVCHTMSDGHIARAICVASLDLQKPEELTFF